MWQIYAAIAAAASNHIGTQMTARNQRAPAYAGDVSVSDALRAGMQGNLDNSPYTELLTKNLNQYNQSENLAMLEQAMPGYSNWSKLQSQQAQDYASGALSQEQLANIQRQSAEGSFASGRMGQAADFSFARGMGLAQYNNSGQSINIMQALENLSKVNLSSVGNFYSTAQDAISTAINNRSANQAYLNAKQASDNTRKNAFWGALSTSGTSWAQMMGGSGQGEDMNAYKSYNDMGYTS